MVRRYVTVDVFTDRMFGGNPLAVVLDAAGLSTREMQAIALEFNYSETTFVLPPELSANTAKVRIFTPRTEVPFAGHPNVGTAFVLARNSPFGAAAAACLSLDAADIATHVHPPQVISVGLPFLAVEVSSRAAHADLLPLDGADAVFAYFRAREESSASGETVLHARTFSPLDGVIEDPATGSACAAAIALLTSFEPPDRAEFAWRIHQGVDMGRPSLLLGRTTKSHGAVTATHIGGRCVAVFEGTFDL
jgi:trans-2,3-dihydro-3-hydroxyanthranilate isomerase